MSPVQILKIVGFGSGAALHLYVAWLIWVRRIRDPLSGPRWAPSGLGAPSQAGFIHSERAFVMLGLCLGSWFLGNLLMVLQELLLGPNRGIATMRLWTSVAVIGIALFPSILMHCHVAFWSWMDGYRVLNARRVKALAATFYIPMLVLPYTIFRVNTGDYKHYLLKLHFLLTPYSVWFVLALGSCAALDWTMKDRLYKWAVHERSVLKLLSVLLVANALCEFMVVVVLQAAPNGISWIGYILISPLPTLTIAYYIYRYNLYDLEIKRSIVYAALAVFFLTIYMYGVRHADAFLVRRFGVNPGVVEGLLVLGMIALAGPLARMIDLALRMLFVREIGLYRDVVKELSETETQRKEPEQALAADIRSPSDSPRTSASVVLARLARHAEQTIERGLGLTGVRVVPFYPESEDEQFSALAAKMKEDKLDLVDGREALAFGASAALGLRREDRLVGILIVEDRSPTLGSETLAILEALCRQIAIGIESCILVEEKLRLEKELAERERLAGLGRMAATVAHEVKNPLSSIKALAQVMSEDQAIKSYKRDLEIIISEIDRLSATVSKLLSFSRSGRQSAVPGPKALDEVVDSVATVLEGEAKARGIRIDITNDIDPTTQCNLDGAKAEALREALANLVLNALQASPDGRRISIASRLGRPDPSIRPRPPGQHLGDSGWLTVSVTDEGSGIPAESISRVFQPFFTTKPRGTGLGLAIAWRLIDEVGGSIMVESPAAHGRGTAFHLIIPASRQLARP